jgi:hypothetical protein
VRGPMREREGGKWHAIDFLPLNQNFLILFLFFKIEN